MQPGGFRPACNRLTSPRIEWRVIDVPFKETRQGATRTRSEVVGRIAMFRRCLAYAVVAACSSGAVSVGAQAQPRATIELFTSQGCSSCPAADKLLGELAADPTLVPISVPIDYWDYLGWKDTLADPRNTARQRAYAQLRGDGKVYTPQVVVNGSLHVLGSDRTAIEHAIAKSRGKYGAMSVAPVTLAFADGHVTVAVAEAPTALAQQTGE